MKPLIRSLKPVDSQVAALKGSAIEAIMKSMDVHINDSEMCVYSCDTLKVIAERNSKA